MSRAYPLAPSPARRWAIAGAIALLHACGDEEDDGKNFPPLSDTGAGSLPGVGQQGGGDRGDATYGETEGATAPPGVDTESATETAGTADAPTGTSDDTGGTTIDGATGVGTDATLGDHDSGPMLTTGVLTTG